LSEGFPAYLAGFRAGSLLAGYRLEAQVGAGGMAVVFRARDERLGRPVALKILAPALTADGAFRRRFMAESRAAAAVDDPHIIPVYEAGEAGGALFIAMRFVMGGDLKGVLEREGALAPGRAAAFISPVASALDAAHRAGLVHRDVKPANILVDARPDRPDHVYLSDFGVSKGAVSSVSLTGAGHFVGTPDYSAPEQIQGLAVDGRADQYALACVAYQLLTGSAPFEREQGMAVLFAHLSAPPPSLSARRPDLPPAVDQVLTRALSKTPQNRYGSCRDFADALREALRLAPYISLDSAPAADHPRTGVAWPQPEFPGPDLAGTGREAVPAGPLAAATVDSAPGGGPTNAGQRAWSEPRSGGGVNTAQRPRHRVADRPRTRTAWIRGHRPLVIALAGAVLAAAGVVPFVLPHSPVYQHSSIIYRRGSIVTADGVTIAESTASNDALKYQRKYPHGPEYAPVTGYDTLYSQTGIEYYENSALKGSDVTLTINSKAQDAAWNALQTTAGGKPGAVVALNPQTGAILAMASYPSYDPNLLATHNATKLNAADRALLQQAGNPLLNRAINFTWPPGSTFNIVTSSAYFTQNPETTPQTNVYSPTQLTLPQTTHVLSNTDGEVCGNGSGQAPLITAFAQSCATTFGSLGIGLGASSLNNFAQPFGMNTATLRIPMPVTQSNYVIPPSGALTAFSAIGQYSDTVTPLQEAMFAATIADGGRLMAPYLVKQVTASDPSTVHSTTPTQLSQPVSPTVASDLGQMMLAVVQNPDGTANAFNTAAVGFTMACETGTAQNGVNNTGLNDAVFTCFAPYDHPQIAVGVIIQGGSYGASAAAPIAVQVIKAYLASQGKQ
jgi:serine/threonine protein kinase